jgi:uncharacterized membrane protein (UPF0127 family)
VSTRIGGCRRAVASALLVTLCAGCPTQADKRRAVPDASAAEDEALPWDERNPKHPLSEHYVAPALPRAAITVKDAFGGSHRVEVEVAATNHLRSRGMMWRKELADGKGMLFIFPAQQELSFWMKNTLIPLDMIFIDASKRVVGVVHNAEPRTLTSRGPGHPSKYVLEVPGGWAERKGVKAGCEVDLAATSMIPVTP